MVEPKPTHLLGLGTGPRKRLHVASRLREPSFCPKCGDDQNAVTSVNDANEPPPVPKPGDMLMCGCCGAWSVIDPAKRRILATEEQVREVTGMLEGNIMTSLFEEKKRDGSLRPPNAGTGPRQ